MNFAVVQLMNEALEIFLIYSQKSLDLAYLQNSLLVEWAAKRNENFEIKITGLERKHWESDERIKASPARPWLGLTKPCQIHSLMWKDVIQRDTLQVKTFRLLLCLFLLTYPSAVTVRMKKKISLIEWKKILGKK